MDEAAISTLLTRIGLPPAKVQGNGWAKSVCPFARWKHASGTDSHPSFGISIVPGGTSRFKCLACGASGDMGVFLWKLNALSGQDYSDIAPLVQHTNVPSLNDLSRRLDHANYEPGPPKQVVAGVTVASTSVIALTAEEVFLPESDMERVQSLAPVALAYLTGPTRNLTPDTIARWGLGWHAGARRIAIPVRNADGRLVGISGRTVDPGVQPKFLHSTGFRRDYYLFGEHLVDRSYKTAFLVEGHFDAIYTSGKALRNTLAVMGSWLSKLQLEKLAQWFDRVVIIPDGDVPGKAAAERWEAQLRPRVCVHVVAVPGGSDPDQLPDSRLTELRETYA